MLRFTSKTFPLLYEHPVVIIFCVIFKTIKILTLELWMGLLPFPIYVIKEVYLKLDTFLNTIDSRMLLSYLIDKSFVLACPIFVEFVVTKRI